MNLWPHQERGYAGTIQACESGYENIVYASPTGGGKTRVMTELLKLLPQSVLYTHRRSLLGQTADVLESVGIPFGYRASGEDFNPDTPTQLAMIQSEHSAVSKNRRSVHNARIVLIDEGHANSGPTAQAIYQQHKCPKVYFTATPTSMGHCDYLVHAGTNTELRKCGAHVICEHYAPDEPDTKLIGKVKIDGGECAIGQRSRQKYCHRVYGSVIDNYHRLNPERRPAILFAPGVAESKWFCEQLNNSGIHAAHIDGEHCILGGEAIPTSDDIRNEIRDRLKEGRLHVVCNRFVLREGVDWPFLYHGIAATLFGGLSSYLQSGGRLLRNSGDWDHVRWQDHGGNSLRHGSLNADRHWELGITDSQIYQMRSESIREKKEPEPIVCPKCSAMRLSGPKCHKCGHQHVPNGKRPVLQSDGTLKFQKVAEWKPKRYMSDDEKAAQQWCSRVRAIQKSKKDTVKLMTFAQLEATIAMDNKWQYPPRTLPMMPIKASDWYRPIQDVPIERLSTEAKQPQTELFN